MSRLAYFWSKTQGNSKAWKYALDGLSQLKLCQDDCPGGIYSLSRVVGPKEGPQENPVLKEETQRRQA